MNFLITNNPKIKLDDSFHCVNYPQFSLYYLKESPIKIKEVGDKLLIYRGYLGWTDKHDSVEEQFISLVGMGNWPLQDSWSGSFSFTLFNSGTNSFSLGADCIGIYPCYYFLDGDKFGISDSLILISRAKESIEIDQTGVFQRMVYEYSNFGARTILKKVRSILPGELLSFSIDDLFPESVFDNSLYGRPIYSDLKKETIFSVYERLKIEYTASICNYQNFYVGLSGGLDSRLILGLVDGNRIKACLNYGDNHFYETKIAKRLAKAYKLPIRNYYNPSDLWPTLTEFEKIVFSTESATVSAWNTILKNLERNFESCILLGDMCESLQGRNIKTFSSRKSRTERFKTTLLLGNRQKFKEVTSGSFKAWQDQKVRTLKELLTHSEAFKETFSCDNTVIDESIEDILGTTHLIRNHDIRYTELYDELFEWYIHARLPMGKQLTIFGDYFEGICPSMGLMAIRTVSKIHPALRLDYKFMDKLMGTINSFMPGNKIPTAQIPLIPFYFPNSLKLLTWGLRSTIDNKLIARLMKRKDHRLRYRVLSSINWPALYHEKDAFLRLSDYFKKDYYNIKEICGRRFDSRAKLIDWPLSNNDIIMLAALNLEIGYILSGEVEV